MLCTSGKDSLMETSSYSSGEMGDGEVPESIPSCSKVTKTAKPFVFTPFTAKSVAVSSAQQATSIGGIIIIIPL